MPDATAIYERVQAGVRFFQGEILSHVIDRQVHSVGANADGEEEFQFLGEVHEYAVILSQDCDLTQHHNAVIALEMDEARRRNAQLTHMLVVVAEPFESMKTRLGNGKQRERVPQNKDERYQFLAGVPVELDATGEGIPDLLLDFKRLFSVPAVVLAQRVTCGETKRRARLLTPYAEHLSVRFGHFYQRVGLDLDHHDARRTSTKE